MRPAKEIFKQNLISLAKTKGIAGGSMLGRLTENASAVGVEKTTCNSLLKITEAPKNLSLDKAEALSAALGLTLHEMLNPSLANENRQPFFANDLTLLKDSLIIAKEISKIEGISSCDFEAELASYICYTKINDISETEKYHKISKIIRKHLPQK